MTSLTRALVAAGTLAIAACGKSNSTEPQGPTLDISCLGNPLATTAPSSIMLGGTVRSTPTAPSPLSGAAVSGFKTGTASALDATTSAADGSYQLTLASGGTPIDGYIKVTKASYIDTYSYPANPFAASGSASVLAFTPSDLSFIASTLGVTTISGDGFVGIVVEDCAGTPIAGATVTTNPSGSIFYDAGGFPTTSAVSTGADGVAYILNVPAGNVGVAATGGGYPLRTHTISAHADAVTTTEIAPGPIN